MSKQQFIRNVSTVVSGTAASQAILMLFAPVITRLYGPEAFGILGVFTSTVAVATSIAALTYPIAIILPKDDSDAKGLVRLSLYIAVAMSALITLMLIIFGRPLVNLIQIEVLTPYLLFIPLVMVFTAGIQVSQQWLMRKKQFKVIAKVDVAQTILVNGAMLGVGLLYPVAAALIFIWTCGHALHTIMLAWGARITAGQKRTAKSLLSLAKKYCDFPIYRAPQVLINEVSQSLPIIMMTVFFGPSAAGFYAIGKRVLAVPAQLIGRAVGDVFYQRITEAAHEREGISKLLTKAILSLAALGLIPFGTIIALGPWLFSFIFGSEWAVAGEYARWLALWSYFMFMNIPSVKTLPVLSAQGFFLVYTIFDIAVKFSTLIVGGYLFKSDLMTIMLYSISGAVLDILLTLVVIKRSNAYDKRYKMSDEDER